MSAGDRRRCRRSRGDADGIPGLRVALWTVQGNPRAWRRTGRDAGGDRPSLPSKGLVRLRGHADRIDRNTGQPAVGAANGAPGAVTRKRTGPCRGGRGVPTIIRLERKAKLAVKIGKGAFCHERIEDRVD